MHRLIKQRNAKKSKSNSKKRSKTKNWIEINRKYTSTIKGEYINKTTNQNIEETYFSHCCRYSNDKQTHMHAHTTEVLNQMHSREVVTAKGLD